MIAQTKHEMTPQRPDAGMTLISVMVAMILLSVGVVSVSQVLTQSVAMQTIIASRTTALDVARAYMEEVKGRDPLTLATETAMPVGHDGTYSNTGPFTRELTVTAVDEHLVEATVIVTLPRSKPIKLVTWIYDGAT